MLSVSHNRNGMVLPLGLLAHHVNGLLAGRLPHPLAFVCRLQFWTCVSQLFFSFVVPVAVQCGSAKLYHCLCHNRQIFLLFIFLDRAGKSLLHYPANLGVGAPATWVLSVTTPNVLLADRICLSCKHDFGESRFICEGNELLLESIKKM